MATATTAEVVRRILGSRSGAALLVSLAWALAPALAAAASVQLEDLTSPALQARVAAGATTVLVPIGGVEQSGPHLTLGKHNVRVRVLASRIADKLGNALVAPVVAYVPEGAIDPPTQHMRRAGTISIPVPVFEGVLEGAARSLRQHGFTDIVLLADHGGYVSSLDRVATKLNREWAVQAVKAAKATKGGKAARVHALAEYYAAAQTPYNNALKQHGVNPADIGAHAGLADTALQLAVAPSTVQMDLAAARAPGADDGVTGDPRRATAELGQLGVDGIIAASVQAIRTRLAAAR